METIRVPKPSTPQSNELLHAELDKMCCRDPKDDFGVFYFAKSEYGADWSENFDGGTLYLGWDDSSRTFLAKYAFDAKGDTTLSTMQNGKEERQSVMTWARGFEHARKWICTLLMEKNLDKTELMRQFVEMKICE